MTDLIECARQAVRVRISILSITMLGAAVALACLVGLVTFPLIPGVPERSVIGSIAATVFVVALPIIFLLTFLIARLTEQKLELSAREELFATAQQIRKLGYWHYSVETGELSLSDNAHYLLGDPDKQQEMSLPKLLDMTNPEDRGRLAESLRRIIAEGTREEHQYRITGFDGVEKTFWVEGKKIVNREGNPITIHGACQDITEQVQTEAALEQAKKAAELSAERLDNVLSSMTDCVITFDRELRVVYLNKRAEEIVPQRQGVVGMMRSEAFPEIISTPFDEHFQRAFAEQTPVEFEGFVAPYDRWLSAHIYPSDEGISVFFKDVSDRRRAQDQLLYLAHHDELTGLFNRTILHECLEKKLETASPEKQTAMLFLDLDEFKSFNDSLGHSAGDRLLVAVGKRLNGCVRDHDVVARFGGDEFAVMAQVSGREEVASLAQRIISSLNQPYEFDGHLATVGVSIGIVTVSDAGVAAEDVFRDADIALYRAKGDGRGIYRIFEAKMGEVFREREALKQDLRGAVARREFSIAYQPLVNLRTNRVNGLEALLRWRHPSRGLVPPDVFIPIAEECGLIVEIGEWVLDRACRDAATWAGGVSVAVNLSPVQFRTADLVQAVSRSLFESGLPGERLQLEITESVLLTDSAANVEVLHALRKLGATISMDDFGTGYSSLSYLRSFPFDKIKIDRAFVSDLSAEDGRGEPNAIVRAILDLARSLGTTTTAEGVETETQLSALRSMGCAEAQGYLISRPVRPEDVAQTVVRLHEKKDGPAPVLRLVP